MLESYADKGILLLYNHYYSNKEIRILKMFCDTTDHER